MNLVPLPFALVLLIGVALAFFRIDWAWMVITAVAALLIVLLGFVSTQRAKDISSLSTVANARLKRFAHYYMYPGTSSGLSKSCYYVQNASLIVAVIGAFNRSWWGFAFAALLFKIMEAVGPHFNPTVYFLTEGEQQAHDEIIAFFHAEIDKRWHKERDRSEGGEVAPEKRTS